MRDSKYRGVYRERMGEVLTQEGVFNPYVIELLEFLFTRTIWVQKNNVFKAYIDLRAYICSTLSLSTSSRLLFLLTAIRHENQQIKYYRDLYGDKNIRLNTYTLVEVFILLASVNKEEIHRDVRLLLPCSIDDIINTHYERLYSLFPIATQQPIINVLRNLSTSLMLDIKRLNKELGTYSDSELVTIVSPLTEGNSIALCLEYIGLYIGLSEGGINALSHLYNNMILDTYQLNQ